MDDTLTGGNIPHYTPTAGRPQLGQHNVVMRILQALGGRHPNDNLLLALSALRPGGGAIMPPAMRAPTSPLSVPRPNPPSPVAEAVQNHFSGRNLTQTTPPQTTPENVTGLMDRLGFRTTRDHISPAGDSRYLGFTDRQGHLPLRIRDKFKIDNTVSDPPFSFRFSDHPALRYQEPVRSPSFATRRSRTFDVTPQSRFSNFNELEQHLYGRLDPRNPNIQSRSPESTQLSPEQLSFLEALLGK